MDEKVTRGRSVVDRFTAECHLMRGGRILFRWNGRRWPFGIRLSGGSRIDGGPLRVRQRHRDETHQGCQKEAIDGA